jgi:dynein heavy chain
MQGYHRIYTECKPKRDALLLAAKQTQIHEAKIRERKEELAKLQGELSQLRDTYREKESTVADLQIYIEESSQRKARAAKLLESLEGEKRKWSRLNVAIDAKFVTIEADCLLAAAFAIYLG